MHIFAYIYIRIYIPLKVLGVFSLYVNGYTSYLCNVRGTMNDVQCKIFCVHYTQCTLYDIYSSRFNVLCNMYNERC